MPFQTTKNVVKVSNLSFSYEKQKVLDDISFEIENHDFLTIIGPNGGGKSTLLKLILGINKIEKGSIEVFGKSHVEQIHRLGYVPQNTNINLTFSITVLEVVMMGQNNLKTRLFGYKKEEKVHALQVLKKVNMEDFSNNKISNLSGGQRQRVLIARALFSKPDILLLDEPTSNIDISGCEQIYKTLQELNNEIPIIVVSHDISVILKYASKAFYVNKKMTQHDLTQMKDEFKSIDTHICEIELLEMLGRCRC